MEESKIDRPKGEHKKYLLPLLIFVGVLILATGAWWYFFVQGKKSQQSKEIFPKKTEVVSVENWQKYENTKYGFSLLYPDNWYADPENQEKSTIVYFSSEKPSDQETKIVGTKVEVAVYQKEAKITLEDWIAQNQQIIQKTADKSEDIEVGGISGKKLTYSSPIPLINVLISPTKNYLISLSYFGQKDDFEKNKDLFAKIIENFKII